MKKRFLAIALALAVTPFVFAASGQTDPAGAPPAAAKTKKTKTKHVKTPKPAKVKKSKKTDAPPAS
jgi:hypothetical protein